MRGILIAVIAVVLPLAAHGASLSPAQKAAIDDSVEEWLARTGAPSVSIAVASGSDVAYAKAYGLARLSPDLPATTLTRYPIGSVAKQFTAAAILLLQEEGKLSLDDKVSKYFPELMRADDITIRNLLSHTAGYTDDAPQEFFTSEMAQPLDFRVRATKPLTFEPGTSWQYSNTGFHIAGAIVERVSGQPLMVFLQSHIFAPLGMARVIGNDGVALPQSDAQGYERYANGPIRTSQEMGPGWRFGSGGLAMSPSDLARWDISLMNRSLLKPQSYDALYAPGKLKGGRTLGYSLGLTVWENHGRIGLGHSGGDPGSHSENSVWPAPKIAIVALTNNGWALPEEVVRRVANVVLPPTDVEATARAVFGAYQKGVVDRGMFTNNANAFLTPAVLADQKAGLALLGPVRTFSLEGEYDRGGLHILNWRIVTAKAALEVTEICAPDGKVEQFNITKE